MRILMAAGLLAVAAAAGSARADGYDTVRAALDAGDHATAQAELARMGDAGDTLAAILLAELALAEVTGPMNTGLAVAWLEEAAANGSLHARLRLGALYQRHGYYVFPDRSDNPLAAGYPEAVEWYARAADDGSADALRLLGGLYRLGMMSHAHETMTRELEQQLARDFLERAVEAGQVGSMTPLGMMVRPDDREAGNTLIRRAAALGEPTALGMLAVRPEEFGVDDPVEALAWKVAARIGWTMSEDPRSSMFIMLGATNSAVFLAAMDGAIADASPQDRAAAEARAAEITAGWTSLLPGYSEPQAGGLFGR